MPKKGFRYTFKRNLLTPVASHERTDTELRALLVEKLGRSEPLTEVLAELINGAGGLDGVARYLGITRAQLSQLIHSAGLSVVQTVVPDSHPLANISRRYKLTHRRKMDVGRQRNKKHA